MPSWILWLLLACLLVLPVLARFAEGDEPDNAITHEQEGEPRQDPDDTLMSATRPLISRT